MKLTLRDLAAEERRPRPGGMATYEVDGVSPDMSFLEMLDVLNERADRSTARSRSPSTTTAARASAARAAWSSTATRTAPSAPPPASCTCAPSATATRSTSSRGGPPPFPVVKDLVVDRSRVRPDHPGRRLHQRPDRRRRPRRTPTPVPKADADTRLRRRRPASAAAPAWPPARTARRCCSPRRKVTHLGALPQGAARARDPRARHGRPDGRRGLRRLHQHRRVHHRLPQGHPAHLDHLDEQGMAARQPQGQPRLGSLATRRAEHPLAPAGAQADHHGRPRTAAPCGRSAGRSRVREVRERVVHHGARHVHHDADPAVPGRPPCAVRGTAWKHPSAVAATTHSGGRAEGNPVAAAAPLCCSRRVTASRPITASRPRSNDHARFRHARSGRNNPQGRVVNAFVLVARGRTGWCTWPVRLCG